MKLFTRRLEICPARNPGVGDHVADIGHAGDVIHGALEP